MPHPAATALILLAAATTASTPLAAGEPQSVELAQVTIRERIIVRVPRMPMTAVPAPRDAAPAPPQRWIERKGPKCLATDKLAGAIVNGSVLDMVMQGGARFRAVIDGDCTGLGFYNGFYFKPAADGQMCAGRDSIRSRSGDSCTIRRFSRLVPGR